jgi:hypothetical protein
MERMGDRNLLILWGIHSNWIGQVLRDDVQTQPARLGVVLCGGALVSFLTNAIALASGRRLNRQFVHRDHGARL